MKKLTEEKVTAHRILGEHLERKLGDYKNALEAYNEEVSEAFYAYQAAVEEARYNVDDEYNELETALTEADDFKQEVTFALKKYYLTRSQAWRDTKEGQRHEAWLDTWEEVDIEHPDAPDVFYPDDPEELELWSEPEVTEFRDLPHAPKRRIRLGDPEAAELIKRLQY